MKKRKFNYIRIKDDQPKKRSKKNEKVWRNIGNAMTVIGTTISSMLLILVVMLCIIATVIVVYVLDFKNSNSFDIDLKDSMKKFTTMVYAYNSDGEEVELKRLVAEQDRIWVNYEDISPNIIHAVVAKEDKRFYEHKGVDWQRTVFALISDVLNLPRAGEGGSTITQQLIKNVTDDKEQTWERKLREIFRALSLEERYTKEDILEYYLNEIGFGGRIYGVEAACQYYFGKSAAEVDIAEGAIIAGIIKNPGKFPPNKNLSLCREQQLTALYALYEQGYISLMEYENAKQEQVKFVPVVYGDAFGYVDPRSISSNEPEEAETPEESDVPKYEAYKWNEGTYEVTQNWYTDAAINQVINDYAELKGITYTSARNEIYSGGYRIYTNMDMEKQEILEEKYRDPKLLWGNTRYDKTTPSNELYQSAFVLMNYTGTVVALAGGLGEKPGDGCFNRATQAVRAPGSTMKPISPYAMAIQNNVITYAQLIPDKGIPVHWKTTPWPDNFEGQGSQSGRLMPAWEAVRFSRNTIPIRLSSLITPQVLYNHLIMNLGFTTLVEQDADLAPVTLGALSEGVHLTELTAAYQIFGNGGVYYEPKLYSRVYDSKDNIILRQDFYGTQAVDSDSAWVLNRMLKTVITSPSNSNLGPYARLGNNVEVIGKTGTSNDEKNFLFVGETPNYVGVIWIGRDNGDAVKWASGIRYHSQIWHDIMMDLEDTDTAVRFTPDPTVIERNYCLDTGLLASSACSNIDVGYYRQSNIPDYCSGNHEAEQQKIRDFWDAFDADIESKIKRD